MADGICLVAMRYYDGERRVKILTDAGLPRRSGCPRSRCASAFDGFAATRAVRREVRRGGTGQIVTPLDAVQVRRYLLGEADEPENSASSGEDLEEADVLDEVAAAEEDLIEDYLENRLDRRREIDSSATTLPLHVIARASKRFAISSG